VLHLDIRLTAPVVEPYESLLADALDRWHAREAVVVASFHDDAIHTFRDVAPGVATAAATGETAAFYFAVRDGHHPERLDAVALQVPMTYGDEVIVTPAFVAAAHEAGLAVHAWTLNDVDEMSRALDAGVDGIISDTPTTAVAAVRDRALAWRR
jgi:glycerophosphoryl diester phosphodiesterase